MRGLTHICFLCVACFGEGRAAPTPAPPETRIGDVEYRGKPLRHWLKQVGNSPEASTEKILDDFCSEIPTAQGDLLKAVDDLDPKVRQAALITLWKKPEFAAAATHKARVVFKDDADAGVRRAAACLLSPVVVRDEAVLKDFLSAMKRDRSPEVRDLLIGALVQTPLCYNPAIRVQLARSLRDPALGVRRHAANGVSHCLEHDGWKETNDRVPVPLDRILLTATISALRDEKDGRVKELLLYGVRMRRRNAEGMVEAVRACLSDRDSSVRIQAAFALIAIADRATAVRELMQTLEQEPKGENSIISALPGLGSAAIPALRARLSHEHAAIRVKAVQALYLTWLDPLGPRSEIEMLLEPVVGLLHDKDTNVREETVRLLGVLSTKPERRLSALCGALEDPEWEVRRTAVYALGRGQLDAEKCVRAIVRVARADPSPVVRKSAIHNLGMLTVLPAVSVPALTRALNDRDAEVRINAALAIKRFGPAAKQAVPALRAVPADDEYLRELCDEALKAILKAEDSP